MLQFDGVAGRVGSAPSLNLTDWRVGSAPKLNLTDWGYRREQLSTDCKGALFAQEVHMLKSLLKAPCNMATERLQNVQTFKNAVPVQW